MSEQEAKTRTIVNEYTGHVYVVDILPPFVPLPRRERIPRWWRENRGLIGGLAFDLVKITLLIAALGLLFWMFGLQAVDR